MPLTADHGLLALARADSKNEKIGDAATTYAAQASCPSSCVFFDGGGCYAENGLLFSGITHPLNQAADRVAATPRDVALAEADAIDALEIVSNQPLRLHTVGDCRTDEAAAIVADAVMRYVNRGGGPVWTYTHAWRTVDRASWGPHVSVLASCETPEQVELARARGYATALVVSEFFSDRLHDCRTAPVSSSAVSCNTGSHLTTERSRSHVRMETGQRPGSGGAPVTSAAILPCPAQTRADVTCSTCGLCMDDVKLRRRGYSIGFAVHGTAFTIKKAIASLDRPSDAQRRLTSRDHALAYRDEHGELPSAPQLRQLADVTWATAREMLDKLARTVE